MLEAVTFLFGGVMPALAIIAGIGTMIKNKLVQLMEDPDGNRGYYPLPGHEIGFING